MPDRTLTTTKETSDGTWKDYDVWQFWLFLGFAALMFMIEPRGFFCAVALIAFCRCYYCIKGFEDDHDN